MSSVDDAARLRAQYSDAGNLNARLRLHLRFSTSRVGWHEWLFDQMNLPPTACLIDVGCGAGTLWSVNAERVPKGWRLGLADQSAGMLREARRELGKVSLAPAFVQASAVDLPFASGSCDAVLAHHMLYHVADRPRALREIHRVLCPGGSLYAATNGRAHLREIDTLMQRHAPDADHSFVLHAQAFGLETGGAQLAQSFPSVRAESYRDSLEITEAQPVIDYVLSALQLAPAAIAAIRREVEETIQREGMFRVAKSSGVFIATKPP